MFRSAVKHRVQGLLWTSVSAGRFVLPRDVALDLAALDVSTRARNERLMVVLEDVVARLDAAGIAVAAFKGVTAEQRWYSRVGERPCGDVDLLLAPTDIGRIDEVIAILDPGLHARRGLRERVALGYQHGVTLWYQGIGIDLHAEIPKLGPPADSTELVWKRTIPMALPSGGTVRVLDAEAHLYAYLTHLIKDRFPTLLGLVDVARLVEREVIDWAAVAELARADRLDRPVALALATVATELGLATPPWPASAARANPTWRVLCRRGALLCGRAPGEPRPRRLLLMPYVAPGRGRATTGHLAQRAFPSRDVVLELYGTRARMLRQRLARGRGDRRR